MLLAKSGREGYTRGMKKCMFAAASLLSVLLAVLPCPAKESAQEREADLSVMAGEMIMTGFRGQSLEENAAPLRALREGKIGGVILFARDIETRKVRNIVSPEQLSALTAQLGAAGQSGPCAPAWIAVDQEGGKVRRLSSHNGFRDWPSALEMGRHPSQQTWETALNMGLMLVGMGINLNFAPSLDLHDPDSPAIGHMERAFSSDPTSVAEHGAAFARGMRDARIVCCYKHFPGHGSAKGDTHNGSADISASWSERELEPFKALLAENMPAMVMVAHVTLRQMDDRPASLSQVVISGLLRHKLGFQGVVVTDDLDMEAVAARYSLKERIRLAVEAGADILLFGNNLHYEEDLPFRVHDTLMELIEEGSISPERIRESYIRIRALKAFIADGGGR